MALVLFSYSFTLLNKYSYFCTYGIPGSINAYWLLKFGVTCTHTHTNTHTHIHTYVCVCIYISIYLSFHPSFCSLCSIINITFFSPDILQKHHVSGLNIILCISLKLFYSGVQLFSDNKILKYPPKGNHKPKAYVR